MSIDQFLSKDFSSVEIANLSNSETLNSDYLESSDSSKTLKLSFNHNEFKEVSQISFCSDESNTLFSYDDFKVYDTPVDNSEIDASVIENSSLAQDLKKLRGKYEIFKKTKPIAVNSGKLNPKEKKVPIIKRQLISKSPIKTPTKSPNSTSKNSLITTQKTVSKSPILTIEIDIGNNQLIKEDVFPGESSYQVAARALKSINKNEKNPKVLRELGDKVHSVINEYMTVITKELVTYEKKVKQYSEHERKRKLDQMKPPSLQTQMLADNRKRIIGTLRFGMVENEEATITIREGDIPEDLAKEFCDLHNLEQENYVNLLESIKDFLENTKNPQKIMKINFEVSEGKIVAIDVNQGDDIYSLAFRFVNEHKLGIQNTSKVYNMLKKAIIEHQSVNNK